MPEPMLVAKGESDLYLLPAVANRHGLVAGATGTGKTVKRQRAAAGGGAGRRRQPRTIAMGPYPASTADCTR